MNSVNVLFHAPCSSSPSPALERRESSDSACIARDGSLEAQQFQAARSSVENRCSEWRTTSPITSSVGAGRWGASLRFSTLVEKTCSSDVVAREMIAHGVSSGSPALRSFWAISEYLWPGI